VGGRGGGATGAAGTTTDVEAEDETEAETETDGWICPGGSSDLAPEINTFCLNKSHPRAFPNDAPEDDSGELDRLEDVASDLLLLPVNDKGDGTRSASTVLEGVLARNEAAGGPLFPRPRKGGLDLGSSGACSGLLLRMLEITFWSVSLKGCCERGLAKMGVFAYPALLYPLVLVLGGLSEWIG
jgi:hypothetical protein